eukprot:jgi/Astpho2/5142/Aster-06353
MQRRLAARPWNHADRIQKLEGVEFSAIVDPNTELAEKRLRERLDGKFAAKWRNCKVLSNNKDLLAKHKPDAAVVGIPPHLHGRIDDPEKTLELDFAHAGVHMLVEKPITMTTAEEVERLAEELKRVAAQNKVIVAVGYMLRFNAAFDKLRELLKQYKVQPTAIIGRYSCPYNNIQKPAWWDAQRSGGPIVEQATHFVDMFRYLSGSTLIQDSIQSLGVGPDMQLSDMPEHGEQTVPFENRNNRATVAIFKFESGAVGSLSHTLLLHGSDFFSELDVFADGFHAIVTDPYQNPGLRVRLPGQDKYQQFELDLSKDMYDRQFEDWLKAIRTGDESLIRSHFSDAAKTYAASWLITQASGAKPPGAS